MMQEEKASYPYWNNKPSGKVPKTNHVHVQHQPMTEEKRDYRESLFDDALLLCEDNSHTSTSNTAMTIDSHLVEQGGSSSSSSSLSSSRLELVTTTTATTTRCHPTTTTNSTLPMNNPNIPTPPGVLTPIPIQHFAPTSNLQRPATQFSNPRSHNYNNNNSSNTAAADAAAHNNNMGVVVVVAGDGGDNGDDDQHQHRPPAMSIGQLIAAVRRRGQQAPQQDNNNMMSVERRLRDFERARCLRRERFRSSPPWGILGLYQHLSGIRADLKWAETVSFRRTHGESYLGWSDYMKDHERNYYHRGGRHPYFVISMTLVSTVMMFYVMYLSNWKFAPLQVNPMIGPPPQVLIEAGALNSSLVVVHGEWYRLFVPLVLHAGIVHFAFNMLAIWFIGGPLEKIHGFTNIGCLFVISAVGGNVLSAVFLPNVISVGASGGIFGLVGVSLADILVNWDLLFLKIGELEERTPCDNIQVLFWLLLDVTIELLIGLTPYVDNFAHVGGLLYGICYALPLADRLGVHFFGHHRSLCFQVKNCTLRLFGFLAGCFLLMASSLLLMWSDGYHSPCEKCRFISCAPFPFWKEDKWWDCAPL